MKVLHVVLLGLVLGLSLDLGTAGLSRKRRDSIDYDSPYGLDMEEKYKRSQEDSGEDFQDALQETGGLYGRPPYSEEDDEDEFQDALTGSEDDGSRKKRDASSQEYAQQLLKSVNEYRAKIGLSRIRLDSALTAGAQEWAEKEANDLAVEHSCDPCRDFSELLARRRSSRPLPSGAEAVEWGWDNWFGPDLVPEESYNEYIDDPLIQSMGAGLKNVQDPADRSYHSYAVARFSKPQPHRRH